MLSLVIACSPSAIKCLPSLEQAILRLGTVRRVQGMIWYIDTHHPLPAVQVLIGTHVKSNASYQVVNVTFLDADAVIDYLARS